MENQNNHENELAIKLSERLREQDLNGFVVEIGRELRKLPDCKSELAESIGISRSSLYKTLPSSAQVKPLNPTLRVLTGVLSALGLELRVVRKEESGR